MLVVLTVSIVVGCCRFYSVEVSVVVAINVVVVRFHVVVIMVFIVVATIVIVVIVVVSGEVIC